MADTGSIHVEAEEAALVSVDDSRLGPAPLDVRNLPAGPHVVQLDVADGAIRRKVLVQAGQTETVYVTTPSVFDGARYRRGMHALLGVGAFGLFEINNGRGVGGQLAAGFNFAFTPRHELRCVMLFGAGPYGKTSGSQTYGLELGFRPSYRKNLGGGYGIELGARLSFLQTYYKGYRECQSGCDRSFTASAANLAVGPDMSIASFRMGDRKQYEVAMSGAILFVPVGMITAFSQLNLTFTYLLLPSQVPPRAP